jgi:hypothetical protein
LVADHDVRIADLPCVEIMLCDFGVAHLPDAIS